MPILDNTKHERFAQLLAEGMSQRQAYYEAYPNSRKWKDATVDNKGSKLANRDEVKARVHELKERAEIKSIATIARRKMILTEILENEEERVNDRIRAIETLNKMDGVGMENINMNGSFNVKNPYSELTTEELRKLAKRK